MTLKRLILASILMAISHVASARLYVPLAEHNPSSHYLPVRPDARPTMYGMRPVEVELLEDTLKRKMPNKVGDSRKNAQLKIIQNARSSLNQQAHLKGILAEALFLNLNPNWGYVSSPTATQHDVYTRVSGRLAPINAQIKTHSSGDPIIYAEDMDKDYRSVFFVIPDDHVLALKRHLNQELNYHKSVNNQTAVQNIQHKINRIRGLGFTYADLNRSYRKVARYALREQYAGYVSLGAAVAMAANTGNVNSLINPDSNQILLTELLHRFGIVGVERVTHARMQSQSKQMSLTNSGSSRFLKPSKSNIIGTPRGNALLAVSTLGTDTAFSVYRFGGYQAFNNENFYTNLGGASLGALTTSVMISVSTVTLNPIVGVSAGLVTGTVANIGGRQLTKKVLNATQPEFMQDREKVMIDEAKRTIYHRFNS